MHNGGYLLNAQKKMILEILIKRYSLRERTKLLYYASALTRLGSYHANSYYEVRVTYTSGGHDYVTRISYRLRLLKKL